MNWLVFHLVSGDAFFTGVALLIIAALATLRPVRTFRRVSLLAFFLGLTAVILSTTQLELRVLGQVPVQADDNA